MILILNDLSFDSYVRQCDLPLARLSLLLKEESGKRGNSGHCSTRKSQQLIQKGVPREARGLISAVILT